MEKSKAAPKEGEDIHTSPNTAMIRVEGVSKKFGKLTAVDQLNFEIKKGEIVGFLGPNGAGKTTVMRILTGFFPPSSGKVWIAGKDLFKHPREGKRKIGYLPESISLYEDMKVSEFLTFVADVKGVKGKKRQTDLEDKMEKCGLWGVKNRLIGQLSKGFRQRIGLAQALVGDPEVLFLDEPSNGLDPKQIIEIRNLIRDLGKERTLVLSSHILPEISMLCDRVMIINKGKLVASGTSDELEAGLKEKHKIYVMSGAPERKAEAHRLLESLDGVLSITEAEETDRSIAFNITVGNVDDLRPAITRKFVEQNLPLLEIRSGRLSLEDIFMKIVVREEGYPAIL